MFLYHYTWQNWITKENITTFISTEELRAEIEAIIGTTYEMKVMLDAFAENHTSWRLRYQKYVFHWKIFITSRASDFFPSVSV
jgi:hypothetical protein